jgi:endosialidase-like protein
VRYRTRDILKLLAVATALTTSAASIHAQTEKSRSAASGYEANQAKPRFKFTNLHFQPGLQLAFAAEQRARQVSKSRSAVRDLNIPAMLNGLDSPVFGHGTVGRIPKWTGFFGNNNWIINDSNIFEDQSGRVGIGTTTPTSLLTVQGIIETKVGGIKFPDGTIQTTAAGLGSLFHNPTLTGNGTSASPLGVAVPLLLRGSSSPQPILTVQNDGFGFAIQGIGLDQNGLAGFSNTADGTSGQTNGANHSGVLGVNTNSNGWSVRGTNTGNGSYGYLGGPQAGSYGFSADGGGVFGVSNTSDGTTGQSGGSGKSGVYGVNSNAAGFGVFGRNTSTTDLGYLGGNGNGVYGFSPGGNGVFGQSTTGLAGNFLGNVSITGNLGLGVTPSGSKLAVAGLIQSTTGGFQFPDGTIQTTAANTSGNFIQNTTTQQPNSNFNISGNGTAGGTLEGGVVTADAFFKIGNHRMVSLDPSADVESSTSTFVGIDAGLSNTNSSAIQNSFFGRDAGRNNNGLDNTFLGYQSGLNNVGNPQFLAGSRNTFVGYRSGLNNGSSGAIPAGNDNTFVGDNAGKANVDGTNNTVIGAGADLANGNLVFATAIGSGAVVSSSETIALGRSDGSDTVDVPGKLQIDTLATAGSTQLCLNSANRVGNCSSSLRYKTAVQPFRAGLGILSQLHPITFKWKTDGRSDIGLGAEDVAAIEPLLITRNSDGQIEGVKYDRLNVVLINAVKQQQEQIEQQQTQLKQQQSVIDSLKKLICSDHRDAAVCK